MADHAAELLDLIEGKWTTQAIGVAAELAIADLIAGGATDLAALAAATGCQPTSLHRLLRALRSLRLCSQDDDGRYALTPLGKLLESDARPSLRAWARWGAREHWDARGHLLESVRTGKSARALAGAPLGYAHLEADPGKAAIFNTAMAEVTTLVATAVARVHDFSAVRSIVDVGGGYGELLCVLLGAHAHLHGVLVDLPHAMDGARARLGHAKLLQRCDFVAGDFFGTLPKGCDACIMKSILHNWDDERAIRILEACRAAIPSQGSVLLVERVMPDHWAGEAHERRIVHADLNMLVNHAGRERTLPEYESLLERVGLTARGCTPLAVGFSLVEASPA